MGAFRRCGCAVGKSFKKEEDVTYQRASISRGPPVLREHVHLELSSFT